ncbi:hypothetical protein BVX97_00935 [bacterium E08(2017)]|nr:hypothetical protein BVX97_00935 [bacterium E08(2017)]
MREFEVMNGVVWGIIPARGGSKSIPLKNMYQLAGRPLIDYAITAAEHSSYIKEIFCSTDSQVISEYCTSRGVTVHDRPDELGGDEVATIDVLLEFLKTTAAKRGSVSEYLVLLEPTSPFILPSQIDECITMIKGDVTADSVQSLSTFPPNHHAYNQRVIVDGMSEFVFKREREKCYNKQLKPEFFVHGNLRVLKSASMLESGSLFGARSLAVMIPRIYSFDADGPDDMQIAECIIQSGILNLP